MPGFRVLSVERCSHAELNRAGAIDNHFCVHTGLARPVFMSFAGLHQKLRRVPVKFALAAIACTALTVPLIQHVVTMGILAQSSLYDDLDYKPSKLQSALLRMASEIDEVEEGAEPTAELAEPSAALALAIREVTSDDRARASLETLPRYLTLVDELNVIANELDTKSFEASRASLHQFRLKLLHLEPQIERLTTQAHQLEKLADDSRDQALASTRHSLSIAFAVIWLTVLVVSGFVVARFRAQREETAAYRTMLAMEKAALNAALKAELEQNTFLGQVSHEINTPLQAILTNVQLLERRLPPKHSCTPLVRRLTVGVSQLCAQVADLLGVSELKSGKLILHPDVTDLSTLLRDTVSLHQGTAEMQGIRLTLEHNDPGLAFVDGRRLAQIVNNLVANAIRYTDKGSVAVTGNLSAHGTTADLVLHVKDTGIGLSPDARKRLFQAFARSKESRGGTGLGLAIVKGLVDEMGGDIQCESAPGRGTEFVVKLPLELRPERRSRPRGPVNPPVSRSAYRPQRGTRVLLVEDDETLRETMGDILTEGGYDLDIVTNVADAHAALEQTQYAAVLVDLDLPDGSGIDVAVAARASCNAGTPLIAMTSHAHLLRGECTKIFDERLRRPVTIDTLYCVLHEVTRPKVTCPPFAPDKRRRL